MDQPITKDIVVLYHKKCPDGFSGAWVAYKKFGDSANYIPVSAGGIPPVFSGKEVYMIDYVPPEETLKDVIASNKSVMAIDHHASSQDLMPLMPGSVFEIDKCGSVLAWEYFFPDWPLPTLLKYEQDVDLWKWQLPNTNELSLYLDLTDYNFNDWDKLAADFEDKETLAGIVKQAVLLVKYRDKQMREMIEEDAQLVEFEGMTINAINSLTSASALGNLLVKKRPPVALVWAEAKDKIHVSLRSDGSIDVGVLAKKYGGGGHRAAAGFRIMLGAEKPWTIITTDEK